MHSSLPYYHSSVNVGWYGLGQGSQDRDSNLTFSLSVAVKLIWKNRVHSPSTHWFYFGVCWSGKSKSQWARIKLKQSRASHAGRPNIKWKEVPPLVTWRRVKRGRKPCWPSHTDGGNIIMIQKGSIPRRTVIVPGLLDPVKALVTFQPLSANLLGIFLGNALSDSDWLGLFYMQLTYTVRQFPCLTEHFLLPILMLGILGL